MSDWIWLVVVAVVGYSVGGIATLWDIRKTFPDLYAELNRRCKDDNP